jgi:hypothetical protein
MGSQTAARHSTVYVIKDDYDAMTVANWLQEPASAVTYYERTRRVAFAAECLVAPRCSPRSSGIEISNARRVAKVLHSAAFSELAFCWGFWFGWVASGITPVRRSNQLSRSEVMKHRLRAGVYSRLNLDLETQSLRKAAWQKDL